MEPLASIQPSLRITGGGSAPGTLAEGRTLVGEVLQRIDSNNVLLQVAGQKVPAETSIELQPGDRFLAQVEHQHGAIALRLMPQAPVAVDNGLVDAVRTLLGDERPLGEVLAELTRAAEGLPEGARRDALLAAIQGRQFDPEGGGAALRTLLHADRGAWPLALAAALSVEGVWSSPSLTPSLVAALQGSLRGLGAPAAELGSLEASLTAALHALALEPAGASDPAAWAARLATLLARELEGRGASLAAELARGQGAALFAAQRSEVLRMVLGGQGVLGGRSELARSLGKAALVGLSADLRGSLASTLVEEGAGRLADAARQALAALDLEEILNVVRREAGEAHHLSLPIPDGDGWATAHLMLLERESTASDDDAAQEGGERSTRVVIGVEFSKLGKVRADMVVRAGAIAARLRASRPVTAALLRASRPELEALLGGEGRRVMLSILDGTDAEVSVEQLAHDVDYLREHHLMDVEG